jgi:hypothetical protein
MKLLLTIIWAIATIACYGYVAMYLYCTGLVL